MEDQNNIHTQESPQQTKSSTGLENNVAGLLCYLGTFVTGIIFAILEKKSPFVKFHAMQSTVTFVGLGIAGYVVDYVPFFGWLLSSLISLLGFILWIVLMVKAYNNEWFKLPIASGIAESLVDKFGNTTNA
ncbi:DUF4870 domain-containing protein [Lederbergia lenta]|uniref:Predicted membrane protein n=1 Tax=Lederbergia lenta TaxID=1467 RepID=A0A2X4WCT5_LEDLE|nr:DUF4870 domain-containing protein [Lederbergia lenta]MCM3110498.1 DUF4870 domain-containing protein [Lederbergia lenta]MEC2323936.1 DUF4870 domain-containing protein [Lederbergia lenta]SQI60991.1 Predicted membrane protein [Lederbergia lenta]